MQPGDLIAGRFAVDRLAREGGMGAIYHAIDRVTGEAVAVKALTVSSGAVAERFLREARVLADLQHPGIVRYIAHGITPSDELFMAMEWLEGEELADRLSSTTPMPVGQAVALITRVAEALAIAHARGVVHRDLKPENIFLVDGRTDRAKLIDFGIARLNQGARAMTRAGLMLGTPGYMAPEQARGDARIDARADVFALGCVLFECLTARAPFESEKLVALLTRILMEPAPHVRDLRPAVPEALDALVDRMLAKDPDDRPPDGQALVAELGRFSSGTPAAGITRPRRATLSTAERRLLCVVLAGVVSDEHSAPDDARPSTMHDPGSAMEAALEAARAAVQPHGGSVDQLLDGSLVVTVANGAGTVTDQAARAARSALAVRSVLADAPIALATGWGVMAGGRPTGEAIDRAASLLEAARAASGRGEAHPRATVRIDEVTAGLLDARFEVAGDEAGMALRAERDAAEVSRNSLQNASPFVGRDAEFATLVGVFDESVADGVARAIVVTAPAGQGKTRLHHEFVAAARARCADVEVQVARGDPATAGLPHGMIAQLVRSAAGAAEDEPADARRERLRVRVAASIADAKDAARVTELLGGLLADPPDASSATGDAVARAWVEWLAARCRARPLLLVLEDLQWGDLPSVRAVDAALRALHECPLTVLALARPEVRELYPRIWADRAVTELQLGELSRRAAERMVRGALGPDAAADVVARVAEQAGGNAFYLEELSRAYAEGSTGEIPSSVIGMVQSRLEGLEPDARRVLRAASVFGREFTSDGVAALLPEAVTARLDTWLAVLVEREFVARRADASEAYAFRSALLREAAYASVTDADRRLGHRLAAEWLEGASAHDAERLAEHFERGGQRDAAVRWYGRAAAQALRANDLAGALARAERGLICDAEGADRGGLRQIQAEAHLWRLELAECEASAREAMQLLEHGSDAWFGAAALAAQALGRRGNGPQLVDLSAAILAVDPERAPTDASVIATAHAAIQQLHCGESQHADGLAARIERAAQHAPLEDPAALGALYRVRATFALFAQDVAAAVRFYDAATASYERGVDERSTLLMRANADAVRLTLGGQVDVVERLRRSIADAERVGLRAVGALATLNLGLALGRLGRLEEAAAAERQALESIGGGDRRTEGAARTYLAMVLLWSERLEEAEQEARRAARLLAGAPPLRAQSLALVAASWLAQGLANDALETAREAMELLVREGRLEEGESLVRLVWAQATLAAGDDVATAIAIAEARDRLLARAAKISDEGWRRSFLENVPENARTVALAREWAATHEPAAK